MRSKKEQVTSLHLVARYYQSSVGKEYFISYEDELGYLYGFIRLLLPYPEEAIDQAGLGKYTALVRELHVYGSLQDLKKQNLLALKSNIHDSGKQLLEIAEKIAQKADFFAFIYNFWVGCEVIMCNDF